LADENFEELLQLACLPFDEPVPPLRVVSGEVVVRLFAMAHGIHQGSDGWHYIKRMPHTNERLIDAVTAHPHVQRVMRLRDPNTVIEVTFTL